MPLKCSLIDKILIRNFICCVFVCAIWKMQFCNCLCRHAESNCRNEWVAIQNCSRPYGNINFNIKLRVFSIRNKISFWISKNLWHSRERRRKNNLKVKVYGNKSQLIKSIRGRRKKLNLVEIKWFIFVYGVFSPPPPPWSTRIVFSLLFLLL